MSKKLKILFLSLIFISILGVVGYAMVIIGYLIFDPEALKPTVSYFAPRFPIIVHAFFGGVALFVGMFQLLRKFREKFSKLNLIFRKIYYTSVIISGVFGFFVSLYAQGGLVNKIGFGMLALLWLYSIARAMRADALGDMATFRVWIVRNYALTLAAVTLRLYIPLIWSFYGFNPEAFSTIYATLGFLCWVPNIVFVEWFYLNKTKLAVGTESKSPKVSLINSE